MYPKISIVIPTFNRRRMLSEAIQSVISQTYTNWELIVVDNNSTDGTMDYMNGLLDSRIKYFRTSNNGSIAASRNLGVNNSVGDWIAFLDSDDLWYPNKLSACSKFFTKENDFLYHHLERFGEDISFDYDDKFIVSKNLQRNAFKKLLIKGNTISTSSVVLRKNLLIEVGLMSEELSLKGIEDFHTWLKISRVSNRFKLVDDVLGYYRIHGDNITVKAEPRDPVEATGEFLIHLSKKEIGQRNSVRNYALGSYYSSIGNLGLGNQHLFKAFLNGTVETKFKSIYHLAKIFFGKKFRS